MAEFEITISDKKLERSTMYRIYPSLSIHVAIYCGSKYVKLLTLPSTLND